MRRMLWILGLVAGVIILFTLLYFINRERMGYIFDLAFDPTRDRLYAVAGDRGLYTFDVSDGHLKRLSRFYDEGYYRNIEVQGTRAYIAEGDRGLVILDISEERPRFISALDDLHGQGLHLAGGLLYLAAGEDGLIIYSLANPDTPREIGRYHDIQDAWDVTVEGAIAYVVDEPRGLEILNVSAPAQPGRISFISWDAVYAHAEVVRVEGGFVFVAAGEYGLKIIDARNPTTPVIAAEYKPGPASYAEGLAVSNWRLYLAIGDESDEAQNGLHILDVRNPYDPQLFAKATYAEWTEGAILQGSTAFLANPWTGLRAYDVSDPTQPRLSDRFRFFP